MNREEAIIALYDGKKVGNIYWNNNAYMFVNDDDILCNYGTACFYENDGYEIWEEPKQEKTCCKEEDPINRLLSIMEDLRSFHKEIFADSDDAPALPDYDKLHIDSMYRCAKSRVKYLQGVKPIEYMFYFKLVNTYESLFENEED